MAATYETATPAYLKFLDDINLMFTIIFTIECVSKLIAYGYRYFTTGWNKFDFIVVMSSLIELALDNLNQASLKMLRVGP